MQNSDLISLTIWIPDTKWYGFRIYLDFGHPVFRRILFQIITIHFMCSFENFQSINVTIFVEVIVSEMLHYHLRLTQFVNIDVFLMNVGLQMPETKTFFVKVATLKKVCSTSCWPSDNILPILMLEVTVPYDTYCSLTHPWLPQKFV